MQSTSIRRGLRRRVLLQLIDTVECGEDCQYIRRVGAHAVVGVGFGEEDGVGRGDDEGCGEGEAPGVGALISMDEGDVDEDAAVVLLHGLGDGVGDAELRGEGAAGVGEDGEGEAVVLDGEVVLADELRGDGDEQGAAFSGGGVELLPGFELGHAVGAPASAEELDDDGADGEEVFGADDFFGEGVLESEVRSRGTYGEDEGFDAGGEEVVDGVVGDGETLGLDELAGVGRDGVELVLETA